MLRVWITTKDRPVTIQDPVPSGPSTVNIPANTTKGVVIDWGVYERVVVQLDALQQAGYISYDVERSDGPASSEQSDNRGNPLIHLVSPGTVTVASLSIDITGYNLLAGETTAKATIVGDTSAGSVQVQRANTGDSGNDYANSRSRSVAGSGRPGRLGG